MRKGLSVNINKTVDRNLEKLIVKITGRVMDKMELKRVKPFYKLVLILKSNTIYDLGDFEV